MEESRVDVLFIDEKLEGYQMKEGAYNFIIEEEYETGRLVVDKEGDIALVVYAEVEHLMPGPILVIRVEDGVIVRCDMLTLIIGEGMKDVEC